MACPCGRVLSLPKSSIWVPLVDIASIALQFFPPSEGAIRSSKATRRTGKQPFAMPARPSIEGAVQLPGLRDYFKLKMNSLGLSTRLLGEIPAAKKFMLKAIPCRIAVALRSEEGEAFVPIRVRRSMHTRCHRRAPWQAPHRRLISCCRCDGMHMSPRSRACRTAKRRRPLPNIRAR